MFGLKVIVLGLTPFVLGILAGKYWVNTEHDAWIVVSIGVAGTVCVLLHAYFNHCVEEEEAEGDEN